jgi:hypothetical protein
MADPGRFLPHFVLLSGLTFFGGIWQALGLEKDTLVVAHADHGWQLGERGEWDK